jgi:rod shape determining protein RodA
MPLSPIHPPDDAPPEAPRTLRLPFDPVMTLAVLGLALCSIVTLKASTRTLIPGDPHYYVDRQAIYLVVGLLAMLGLSRLDYSVLRRYKNGIYVALLVSILAVLGLGHAARGSQRAIAFPLFSFQASELGKVLLILALSAFVVERSRHLRERDTTVRVMIAALVPTMFVIAQPDLGSGMVYMVIAYMLLFVAGASWRHLVALAVLVAASAAFVLVAAPAAGVHVLKPYQVERLTAFLHPSEHLHNSKGELEPSYQQQESKIAIGAGEKTGRGENASQIPNGFVPESSRALRVLVMAKDLFGSLIAAGVAAMLMFQVFVNVGMTIGIMPITGVTLPLMSYGGSSVITTLLAVGLLQSIYVQARASAALKGRVTRF